MIQSYKKERRKTMSELNKTVNYVHVRLEELHRAKNFYEDKNNLYRAVLKQDIEKINACIVELQNVWNFINKQIKNNSCEITPCKHEGNVFDGAIGKQCFNCGDLIIETELIGSKPKSTNKFKQ